MSNKSKPTPKFQINQKVFCAFPGNSGAILVRSGKIRKISIEEFNNRQPIINYYFSDVCCHENQVFLTKQEAIQACEREQKEIQEYKKESRQDRKNKLANRLTELKEKLAALKDIKFIQSPKIENVNLGDKLWIVFCGDLPIEGFLCKVSYVNKEITEKGTKVTRFNVAGPGHEFSPNEINSSKGSKDEYSENENLISCFIFSSKKLATDNLKWVEKTEIQNQIFELEETISEIENSENISTGM